MAYQCYDKLEEIRCENVEPAVWAKLSNAFLDHFIPRELRKTKAENFVNLK